MKLSTLFKFSSVAVAAVATLSTTGISALSDSDGTTLAHRNLALTTERGLKAKESADAKSPTKESTTEGDIDGTEENDEGDGEDDNEEYDENEEPEPTIKKKKVTPTKKAPAKKTPTKKEPVKKEPVKKEPVKEEEVNKTPVKKSKKRGKPASEENVEELDEEEDAPAPKAKNGKKETIKDIKRFKGFKREGVIDDFADGAAEIDKISADPDGWVSILSHTPERLIRASLYAFLAYNDTKVCTTFNMTFTTLEQKRVPDGNQSHAVIYVNCTLKGVQQTPGKFVLNFVPEGDRLLLTECGHREAGEIVNWLMIKDQVPQCMTPNQRREFLTQPLKHIKTPEDEIALATGKSKASTTNFFSQITSINTEEAAILGSATFALISVIVIIAIFIARKRKAQLDLERTIAGAKVEKAAEDDPTTDTDTETTGTVERKGLMDTAKANCSSADAGVEEGTFVNSPAVKIEIK
ncbi:hypothetical protein ABG067_001731 [Albugo candida]